MGGKNALLIQIATLFADNANGDISPSDLRTGLSAMVSADLNLEELTTQEILGAINFTGGITKNNLDVATVDMVPENIPSAYCDYSVAPNLTLTTAEQLLTGWTAETVAVGISELNGIITADVDGVYNITLERIYENDDNNPALKVNVSIVVYADDQQGGGPIIAFQRTAPISSATAGDEPAILAFSTPANRPVTAGTEFSVYVSAEDNGANPQDTRLIRAKVVANLIHNLP